MAADLRLILLMLGAGIVTYIIFRMINSMRYKNNKITELENTIETQEDKQEIQELIEPVESHVSESYAPESTRPLFNLQSQDIIVEDEKIKDEAAFDPLLSGYTDYNDNYIEKKQEQTESVVSVVENKLIDTETVELNSCMEKVVIEDIISIYILPRNRRTFTGRSILTTLKTMNFIFTDKHVFQRFQEPDTKNALFTVASMVEPGIFNIHTLGTELLPGLVLFLTLPHSKGALSSFESMLANARQLAAVLGGDLCDSKRNHLTGQTIVHYRERVQEHLRRQLTKMRAAENA